MRTSSGAFAAALVVALAAAGCTAPAPGEEEGPDADEPVPSDGAEGSGDATSGPGVPEPNDGGLGDSGSTDQASTSTSTATAGPTSGPTSEPLGAAPSPGNSYRTLDVAGRGRTYLLHVPPGLAAGQSVPLLVMLHPAMTSGSQVQAFYGMDAEADEHGFIVAYPDGTPESDPTQHTWNAGYCCGAGRDTASQDIEFIVALVQHLLAEFPIDPGHVGLAGHSNGGMLAHRVAATRSDLVSAIMVVAGSIGGQEDRHHAISVPPTPAGPVDVLIVHATDDSVVAYEGGNPPGPFEPSRIDLSVHDAVDLWRDADGLTGDPAVSTAGVVVTRTWTGGTGGAELVFVTTEGGHGWPGVPGGQPPFFRSPAEPAATPLVAGFFLAHPRG